MSYRIDKERFCYNKDSVEMALSFKAIKQKLKNTTKINVKKNIQAKLTALAVNLKRIASILSSLKLYPLIPYYILGHFPV